MELQPYPNLNSQWNIFTLSSVVPLWVPYNLVLPLLGAYFDTVRYCSPVTEWRIQYFSYVREYAGSRPATKHGVPCRLPMIAKYHIRIYLFIIVTNTFYYVRWTIARGIQIVKFFLEIALWCTWSLMYMSDVHSTWSSNLEKRLFISFKAVFWNELCMHFIWYSTQTLNKYLSLKTKCLYTCGTSQ